VRALVATLYVEAVDFDVAPAGVQRTKSVVAGNRLLEGKG
jgi:hypothetical protein